MAVCSMCMKSPDIGHAVSHAKNRVRAVRRPNLHSKRMMFGTSKKRVKICSTCLRTLNRAVRLAHEAKNVENIPAA